MDSHKNGRYFAEMVLLVGGDEKEGRERKDGGNASAQGGARVRREVPVSCTKFQSPQHGGDECRSW